MRVVGREFFSGVCLGVLGVAVAAADTGSAADGRPKTNISVPKTTHEVAPAAAPPLAAPAPPPSTEAPVGMAVEPPFPVPDLTAGPEATAPEHAAPRWHEGLFPPARIYVEPLVLTQAQDREVLREAAALVATLFEVPVEVRLPEAPRPDLPNAAGEPYRPGDRLLFPPVAAALQYTWRRDPALPDALAVIAVSGAPIGFPTRDGRVVESATWSMRGQGIAAVSLPLLLEDLPGTEARMELVRHRLARAMARMLGQALGLSESADPDSVMARPATPADADATPLRLTRADRTQLETVRGLCALADGRVQPQAFEDALGRRTAQQEDAAATALLAIMQESRGGGRRAEDALRAALEQSPNLPRLHLSRARLAFRKGAWADTTAAWDRLVELQPHARTWAGGHPPDWLLTHHGLPGRDDGAAAPDWQDPLERAQTALARGEAGDAAAAAQEALTRELELAVLPPHPLFAARTGPGTTALNRIGVAAGVLAVALAREERWDGARDALDIARQHLPAHALQQLEHVAVRIAVGRDEDPAWASEDRTAQPDRLREGLLARKHGDLVGALDAWAPLLPALETDWAPNVPVVELADAYATRGDISRARDVLVRAAQVGQFEAEARDLLARLDAPDAAPSATPYGDRVRRFSIRRFRPAIAVTPQVVWFGTSDGLLRLDRDTRDTSLQHVAQGLPAGAIQAIAADGDALWLGTTSGLYWRREAGPWKRMHDETGLPVPAVTTLRPGPGGAILAGTVTGLCRATGDSVAWWPEGLPRARVAALDNRDGVIAASFTRSGPAVWRRGAWQRIAAPNPVATDTRFGGVALDDLRRLTLTQTQATGTAICRETPFAIYCDDLPAGTAVVGPVGAPDGRLWLAAGREVAQWDRAVGWMPVATLPDADPGPVLTVQPDALDTTWIVTAERAYLLHEQQFEPVIEYAPRAMWRRLIADSRGGVWKVFDRTIEPPEDVAGPRTLPPGRVASPGEALVVDPDGAPWAVAGGRLYKADGPIWTAVAELPAAATGLRLWLAERNAVWGSAGAVVWSWQPEQGWVAYDRPADTSPDPPAVRGIAHTTDGRVWIAWADRLQVMEDGELTDAGDMPHRTLTSLAAVEDTVWVGTAHDGVYRLGQEPGHWARADGLPDNRIVAIAGGPHGVWLAGADGAVARWDGTAWQVHHVGNLDGPLAADAIVTEANGTVWFQVGETWYEHRPETVE